jgi:hypothetical protein
LRRADAAVRQTLLNAGASHLGNSSKLQDRLIDPASQSGLGAQVLGRLAGDSGYQLKVALHR